MKTLILLGALLGSCLVSLPAAENNMVTSSKGSVINAIPKLLKDGEPYYFVTARGFGRTANEAKDNAFRIAIDQAVGSTINSEYEVKNNKLVRSDVAHYSAGFVDKFEIKQVREVNGLVETTVDIYVKRSKLTDRLLGQQPATGKFDSERAQAQYSTIQQSRQEGDKLLSMVLADFPQRAFDITPGPNKVYYDSNRRRFLELSFIMRWRWIYLENMREILAAVSQDPNAGACLGSRSPDCQYLGFVTIRTSSSKNGWSRTAAFNDAVTYKLIYQHLIESMPAVMIEYLDKHGNTYKKECKKWAELDNNFDYHWGVGRFIGITEEELSLNGYFELDAKVPVALPENDVPLAEVKYRAVRAIEC